MSNYQRDLTNAPEWWLTGYVKSQREMVVDDIATRDDDPGAVRGSLCRDVWDDMILSRRAELARAEMALRSKRTAKSDL